MKFHIRLDEKQIMSLIEMVEQHRAEGEEKIFSDVRHSIRAQFQEQFQKREEQVAVDSDDVLSAAKQTLGPNYCDNCD